MKGLSFAWLYNLIARYVPIGMQEPAPIDTQREDVIRELTTLYVDTCPDKFLSRDAQFENMFQSFTDTVNGNSSINFFGGLLWRMLTSIAINHAGDAEGRQAAIDMHRLDGLCLRLGVEIQKPTVMNGLLHQAPTVYM